MHGEMRLEFISQAVVLKNFWREMINLGQDILALGLGPQIEFILQSIHMLWRCRESDG